jgi:two-component system, cell cycle sensor histidine kinase and response regulator CckA
MAKTDGRGTFEETMVPSVVSLRATYVTDLIPTDDSSTLAALRISEARFRAALDASYDAFVIADAVRDASGAIVDFLIVEANANAAAAAGDSVDALRGQSLFAAFPHGATTGLWEQCCRVVTTQTPVDMAHSVPVPGMPRRWVQRQVVPVGLGVAIASRDVSAREQERRALEVSEARHRQLFESSAAIQLIVDEETGALLDVNPAAEAFYGWSGESMRAMQITDLDDRTMEAWRAELPREPGVRAPAVVHKHRSADRQPRDVEIAASRIQYDGRLARHLIVHDVSDRARAEAQLRESEARFRAVIGGMSEGVVIHDASGAIRAFNPSAERILGLSGAQLRGLQPIHRDWQAVHEDGTDWPIAQHPAQQALRTGRSQPRVHMGIRRGDEREQEEVWLQVTADPLIEPGESVPYAAVAVYSDVTLQRSAEERLRQAQKLEAVGQLAGGIAHDFNNLLTVIRGAAGFLVEGIAADSPLREDVDALERATERAEELTRRLLAIGRRQLLRTEAVDLRALMEDQYAAIRETTSRTIRVQRVFGEVPVMAQLDRRQVLDAVRTLVDNARDAMPGGGTLTLTTAVCMVERPGAALLDGGPRPYAMLEVRDTGEGMTDEVRARLFEPFFSTQPFGANHGMGLASVHGMVAQSHGFIECDSAPGEGTALRLFFPATTKSERSATPPGGASAVTERGILLVDDDPMLRDLARRMLERAGRSVAVASSGVEALDVLHTNAANVAVLVTDLTMPGLTGIELIDAAQRDFPTLPIVAISGYSMHGSVREELAQRGVVFLGKPFQAGELIRAIEKATTAETAEY